MSAESKNEKTSELIKVVLQKDTDQKKKILNLLKLFSSSLRKIPLYPASHPMVKDSVLQLYLGLMKFFEAFGEMSLDVLDQNIVLCGQPLDSSLAFTRDLAADLKKVNIEGLILKPGLSDIELEKFLRMLTFKAEVIEEKGGLKKLISDEQIEHIHLVEVHYARVSEEEEVAKKGAKSAGIQISLPGEKKKDIVAEVGNFLGGMSEVVPQKEAISFEFKRHARRLVKQLLKLIGPEKAIDEVLEIIKERFDKAGFTDEEQQFYMEKLKTETIKLKVPKVTKTQLEKKLKLLQKENESLKEKLGNSDLNIRQKQEENERLKEDLENFEENVEVRIGQATELLAKENRKIKREKESINSVLRNVAEGLVIVDKDGKVLVLNPAAEKLLGVDKGQKVGKHILDGLKEEQIVSLSKEKHQKIEIELSGPSDKTKKTLRASTAVIENDEGQTVGVVSVLSDITKQKEIEKMKDALVSNVTHDLRAPLISIQKSLSLILETGEDKLADEQKQFLQIASNNTKRLTSLVNDLLDVSKLESGRMRLEYSKAGLTTVVDGVYDLLRAWSESRGVCLKQEGLENVELDIDLKLFNQVLTNLVGNAIKFTPSGGEVTVKAQPADGQIKISVRDTGCGIPADSLELIFDKFEQARSVNADGTAKGTGLGLSIVKEIVLLHGGKVWAESEEGKGSVFNIVIPKEKKVLDSRD